MADDMSFLPKTPVRPNTLYVSRQLFKALGYVARVQECSREDLVERQLNEWLMKAYPDIVAHLQAVEVTEKAFLKQLKPIHFQ